MRNQDGASLAWRKPVTSGEPVLVVIDYVTMPRGGPPRRTRRKRRGRLYKSDGVEEVGRMMNVLSEPSRQRGSVARL